MTFENVIKSLVKLSNSEEKIQKKLLTPSSISLYTTAFTSETFDQSNNYEFLRGVGEITFQQIIVQYIIEKYPLIFTPEKKAIVTDMKKYLVQGDFFIDYFKQLYPSKYIQINTNDQEISDRVFLDVFQAFLGATERILYKTIDIGYNVCYNICKNILDKFPKIQIEYETFVDPKTILKEMVDRKIKNLGYIAYNETKGEVDKLHNVKVTRNNIVIGEGVSKEKIKAEKQASKNAINFLKSININYELPQHYRNINYKTDPSSKRVVIRQNEFYKLMKDIMQTGIDNEIVLEQKDMDMFSDAFTHSSTDYIYNYEVLETLGDTIVNKAVVQYLIRRFPQINCPDGKEILTKLKISLVNWKSYSELAESLGFLEHIVWNKNLNTIINIGKLQEDVFESFFGAVSYIMDISFGIGAGYKTCYIILSKILDKKDISLKYEDIVDPKTIIKEIFDQENIKKEVGKIDYAQKNLPNNFIVKELKLTDFNNNSYVIGQSIPFKHGANIKESLKKADMEASISSLKYLANKSIVHPNSKKFEKFC
jgi:ribonuclease-3